MQTFTPVLAAAHQRYQRARSGANAASWLFDAETPRIEIAPGLPGRGPRYAYSEEEIEATWGQFRRMSPGPRCDVMERGYHERIAEFRAKKAIYDREYEACGYAAADREYADASLALYVIELEVRGAFIQRSGSPTTSGVFRRF